jgi:hypothetical protein
MDRDIWLDARLAMGRPVLYVAFGSQAEMSHAQLEEIAVGLDRSGVDFLWVLRSKWFTTEDRLKDRFGDRGKVVEGFIDQLRVLGHKSIRPRSAGRASQVLWCNFSTQAYVTR